MELITTTIGLKFFTLIFILGFVRKVTSSRLPFGSAEINISVPKPTGDILSHIPGLSSFLKTNHQLNSVGTVSFNENIPQQHQYQHQQQQPYQYTAENYQYMSPNTNPQNGYYTYPQQYYNPPPPGGYYGHGYYPQYTLTQPNWNQYQSLPALNQPKPFKPPVNPSDDKTPKMPPLAPIKDPNKPILKVPSPYREIPRSVITPDSPLYVHIPEEPTIYGIEPRR